MPSIVYVLTNEAMPGLVKIGLTTDSVESRIAQLTSHSGIPLPFECYFAAEVGEASRIESILHQLFSENRVNPRREFFRLDAEKVVLALSIGGFKEIKLGTPEIESAEKDALDKVKARRPRLRLDAIGISPGDTLTFSRDETVTAKVLLDNKIEFEGNETSLSAAALEVLTRMGYSTPTAAGTGYWMFDGELLDERRRRIEAEQFTGDTDS